MALNVPPPDRKAIASLPALPSDVDTLDDLPGSKIGARRTKLSPLDAEQRPQSDFVQKFQSQRQSRPRPQSRPKSDARKSEARRSAIASFNPFGPIIFEGQRDDAQRDDAQRDDAHNSAYRRKSYQSEDSVQTEKTWDYPDDKKINPLDSPPRPSSVATSIDSLEKNVHHVQPEADAGRGHISGWRLNVLTITLLMSLFISVLEVSIVSTSLVIISNNLGSYTKSNWIVISYLLTYTGFLIIWAKASDVLGRKNSLCGAIFMFVVFSAACGATQTINQLIVCRAFQGIGGAGVYSLVMVIVPESAPPGKIAKYSAFLSIDFALAYLFGPLLGGVINISNAWRWVFFLNVPSGGLALAALFFIMPHNFPEIKFASKNPQTKPGFKQQAKRLDAVGALFLLAASIFLVTALTQAGTAISWGSAEVIVLLSLSACLWIGFFVWSWYLDGSNWTVESIFPWRFMKSRPLMGVLINTVLTGAPFTVAVIILPERFQTVNAASALKAGIRILPFALSCPVGSTVSSMMVTKFNIYPVMIVLAGGIFQTIGAALMSIEGVGISTSTTIYGYEVLLGFGLGMNIAAVMCVAPYLVERRYHAAAMGAVTQFRILGGALGLAIGTNILNSYVRKHLTASDGVSQQQVDLVLSSPGAFAELPPEALEIVRQTFGHGYNMAFKAMIAFAGAQLPGAFLLWGKRPEEGAMP